MSMEVVDLDAWLLAVVGCDEIPRSTAVTLLVYSLLLTSPCIAFVILLSIGHSLSVVFDGFKHWNLQPGAKTGGKSQSGIESGLLGSLNAVASALSHRPLSPSLERINN